MNRLPHRCCWTILALMVFCSGNLAASTKANITQPFDDELLHHPESTPTEIVARTERGITGVVTFTHHGLALQVKNQRDVDAPLIVRLRKADQPERYEARYIGNKEGIFDLRDTLEHADGSAAVELAPMNISIVSTLPTDQRSDLFAAAIFQPQLAGGYRVALVFAFLAWLAIPLIIYAIRVVRRPAIVAAPPPPRPATLADQLRPLVAAAASRPLTTPEKGRLELLLVHYWRERAELPTQSMANSIRRLRYHPEAGPLLNAVENWLHRAAPVTSSDSDRSAEVILSLLKPYQTALALDLEDSQVPKGSL